MATQMAARGRSNNAARLLQVGRAAAACASQDRAYLSIIKSWFGYGLNQSAWSITRSRWQNKNDHYYMLLRRRCSAPTLACWRPSMGQGPLALYVYLLLML